MVQRAVASWIKAFQTRVGAAGRTGRTWESVDADLLGRQTNPCEAVAQQFPVNGIPGRGGVHTATDIQPLDHHRPVKSLLIDGPANQDAGLVVGGARRRGLPVPVRSQGSRVRVSAGGAAVGRRALEEKLLLDLS